MSRKLYAAFVPLLAVIAFAVMPAIAQAEPHWYKCEAKAGGTYHDPDCTETAGTKLFAQTRLPFTSEKLPIATYGILVLHNATLGTVTCHVVDEGNIWNTTLAAAGKDEITLFTNSSCVASPTACPGITITALRKGSPLSETNAWPTHLIPGPPIRDVIEEIEIKVVCPGVIETTFTGTLMPKIVNGSPSFAEFDAESGHLTSSLVGEAKVTGKDFLAEQETGDNIDVVNP